MSTHSDRLARVETNARLLLESRMHGTEDSKVPVRLIDLAVQRNRDWQKLYPPPSNVGERGGSSSPAEVDDRTEEGRIAQRIYEDAREFEELTKEADRALRRLHKKCLPYTEPIDHAKLPIPKVPGCVSCARRGTERNIEIGGCFAPAMPPKDEKRADGKGKIAGNALAARLKLCRPCFDHAHAECLRANAPESRIMEFLPPVKYCDLYHRVSPRAAGNWLAEQEKRERMKRGAA